MSGQKAKSLKQNMFDRGETFHSITTILRRSEVSELDLDQLQRFSNTDNKWLSDAGRDLKSNCLRSVAFFKTLKKPPVKDSIKGLVIDDTFLPSGDKFIRNFVSTYMENKAVRDSLLVGLMQAYISKLSGYNHPVYGTAVTNFFLSLAGTGSKQAVEFVSANLGKSISIRHLQRIQAKKRPDPFIVHSNDDVIGIVLKQFGIIRSKLGDPQ
jgi:hypothetical protein